jgi:hypothetical protein
MCARLAIPTELDQGKAFAFQKFVHLNHAFVCISTGSKEELHRKYYSNYHLPEDGAGEE